MCKATEQRYVFIIRGVRQLSLFVRKPAHFDLFPWVVKCGCTARLKGLGSVNFVLVIVIIIVVDIMGRKGVCPISKNISDAIFYFIYNG